MSHATTSGRDFAQIDTVRIATEERRRVFRNQWNLMRRKQLIAVPKTFAFRLYQVMSQGRVI